GWRARVSSKARREPAPLSGSIFRRFHRRRRSQARRIRRLTAAPPSRPILRRRLEAAEVIEWEQLKAPSLSRTLMLLSFCVATVNNEIQARPRPARQVLAMSCSRSTFVSVLAAGFVLAGGIVAAQAAPGR